MANLRSLLGKEFGSTVDAAAAEYASLSKLRDGKVYTFQAWCQISKQVNYRDNYAEYWCMPCGTTQATFEIWGGGGGGAGACCCAQGIPGGSGAYSRKTITSEDGYGDMGGWCFYLYAGEVTDCNPSCLGYQGCKSYVCGTTTAAKNAIGSNFCAEGGVPGKTCCEAFWSNNFRCQDRVYWTGCGGYDPATDGAVAYGGDENVKGNVGFFRIYNTSDNCWAKLGMPYPPRLMDHKGGHVMAPNGGNGCGNERAACQGTTPYAFTSGCSHGLPGLGAPSASTCGGTCCCGWTGSGGLVKVTYCSCWLGVNEACAIHFCN